MSGPSALVHLALDQALLGEVPTIVRDNRGSPFLGGNGLNPVSRSNSRRDQLMFNRAAVICVVVFSPKANDVGQGSSRRVDWPPQASRKFCV